MTYSIINQTDAKLSIPGIYIEMNLYFFYYIARNFLEMNNKTILWVMLFASASILQSCSEEDVKTSTTNSPSNSPNCYIIQEIIDDGVSVETIDYTYNDLNQITATSSTTDGGQPSVTTFEYDGERITTATDISTIYEFDYSGSNTIPSRVSMKEGTTYTGYYALQSNGNKITEFEEHSLVGTEDITIGKTTFEYDAAGNVSTSEFYGYDDETNQPELLYTFSAVQYDGKQNPYKNSFVFFFVENGNPTRLGNQNLVSGKLKIEDIDVPYVASFEYNSKNYPTSISITALDESNNISITYDCK